MRWIFLNFLVGFCLACLPAYSSGEPERRSADSEEWHSALYPANWTPEFRDAEGRFLHDFSFAGYRFGETPPEAVEGEWVNVTEAPYLADSSGEQDSTTAIQQALDEVGKAGGGVVYLPAGTYRIAPIGEDSVALRLRYSGVVLRGAGAGETFLYSDDFQMRKKVLISVEPGEATSWNADGKDYPGILLVSDEPTPTQQISLAEVEGLAVGDAVVIRNDLTQHYIDRVGMTGKWEPAQSRNRTLTYYRRITRIDPEHNVVTVDIPVRGYLYQADNARVVPVTGEMIREVGVEDFSIGMAYHPGEGDGLRDFLQEGTLAYEVHGSAVIRFKMAENGWVRRVNTYAPEGNPPQVHILSNALQLERSRGISVLHCDLRFPQYRGEGGNGYLYTMQGQDNLVEECYAEAGRHNFSFGTMSASGNVIVDCYSKDGWLGSDFHMFLSLANLFDSVTCEGDFLEARALRPWGGKVMHGVTTTESVFWNTCGLRYSEKQPYLIFSHQFGDGYIIGTRGPAYEVKTSDFAEGIGKGETLVPRSLYEDQRMRRVGTVVE